MGSFAALKIGDFVVHESKNHVDYVCTVLFTEGDRDFPLTPDGDDEPKYVYTTSVQNAIERLEILGVTYEKAKEAFAEGVERTYSDRWEKHTVAHHLLSEENLRNLDDWEKEYYESVKGEREWDLCEKYTFENWLAKTLDSLFSIHDTVLDFRVLM